GTDSGNFGGRVAVEPTRADGRAVPVRVCDLEEFTRPGVAVAAVAVGYEQRHVAAAVGYPIDPVERARGVAGSGGDVVHHRPGAAIEFPLGDGAVREARAVVGEVHGVDAGRRTRAIFVGEVGIDRELAGLAARSRRR